MLGSLHRAWVRINRATRGVPQRLVSDALLVAAAARLAVREIARGHRGRGARVGMAENPRRTR